MPNNVLYIALGIAIGAGIVFYQVDTPRADRCETYKVARKPVTAFVLKPPPAPPAEPVVVYKACPQTTQVSPTPESQINTDEKMESINQTDKQRRHRRHWRRRHWR